MRNMRRQKWRGWYNKGASVERRRRRRRHVEERTEERRRWWRRWRWKRWERRWEWRWRWGHKLMRPRGNIVASAMVVTVVSVVVSVVMSMTKVMPAWTPMTPFEAMRVSHVDVFTILRGGDIIWSFPRSLVVIHGETKETTWPRAATEGTNVLLVLFL
jgi:hypothetical protein